MSVHEQKREEKLLAVLGIIFVCAVVKMVSSYLIGNYVF